MTNQPTPMDMKEGNLGTVPTNPGVQDLAASSDAYRDARRVHMYQEHP